MCHLSVQCVFGVRQKQQTRYNDFHTADRKLSKMVLVFHVSICCGLVQSVTMLRVLCVRLLHCRRQCEKKKSHLER